MGWDIEFDEFCGQFLLIIENTNTVYALKSDNYEHALDEAGAILDSIGFYEEF